MSNYCVIHPRLSNGEKSPLFTRLKDFFGNREEAENVYYKAINPAFKEAFPKVRFDKNNEPLFEDLLDKCGIGYKKSINDSLKALNKEYATNPVPKTLNSVIELQQRAAAFNANNSKFSANLVSDNGKVNIEINTAKSPNKTLAKKQKYNAELNKQLTNLLNSWGFEVGALTEVEEKSNINGIMDLDAAENAATGLKTVIRLAKDEKGQTVLPEEWGHFVVEAVNTPLKDRILNTLKNEDVLREILGENYERYSTLYNDDIELMAKEALGKMMAEVLNHYDVNAPNNALFNRYKDVILNAFSSKDATEIDKIINQVREMVYDFTTKAFAGKYKLNIDSLNYQTKLYNLGEEIKTTKSLLETIINKEKKREQMYGSRATRSKRDLENNRSTQTFDEIQRLFIERLERQLKAHQEIEGIIIYLDRAVTVMKQLSDRVSEANSITNNQAKFKALRGVRNYMASYASVMDNIRTVARNLKKEGNSELWEKTEDLLTMYSGLAANLGKDWIETAKDEFADFIKEFEGEAISTTIRGKRKQYTIKEILSYAEKDISIVERWIDAAADSTDPLLRIYDSIVKKQKNKARLQTIEDEKEILKQAKILEDAGITNTEFMYEKSSKGRITGKFVTKYNWGNYSDDLYEYINSLDENLSKEEKQRKISEWKRKNFVDGHLIDKYLSQQYIEIQNNKAMKQYYDFIMTLKKNKDYNLPVRYVYANRAPQIRRDFLQRILGKGNKAKYLWENIKDNFIRREDDIEFAYAIQDFEGNPVHTLPIYYTKQLQDMNDLSLDCTSAMVAYSAMTNDYAALEEVVNALETGKQVLEKREIARTKGGKVLSEIIDKVPNKLFKRGSNSYFMDRLNDFMSMQLYGEMQKDEGKLLGMDAAKFANTLNKLQSYGTTALSVLTGTANMAQNIVLSNIEAVSKRFFSAKDLAKADLEYAKMLPAFMGELGNRIKTSKMALFAEKFNVLQDYKQSVRDIDWNRKTWASRFFKEDTLWFTTSAGDHYTQMRTAIALALNLQLIDKNGKAISLYDALDVEYIDKNHPEYGARLIFKEGVTDSNGNKIGLDYIDKVTKKIRGINDKLYGIYNQEDKSAMQSYAIGRVLMMYRNWMRPLYLKRYGVERYNMDTDTFEEGYYRTLYNFLSTYIEDVKKGESNITEIWNNLSAGQKSNIYRAVAELATFAALLGIVAALKSVPDDKKDKNNWLTNYVSYAIIRLKADLGALIPGPTMLDEGLRLFDNPFAAVRVLKNIRQLFDLIYPDTWTTEIESGIYKGHTKAGKIIIQPIPFVRQIQNIMNPEEPAKWYK